MITNLTRNTSIAVCHETASNPWQRMKGLLGRRQLAQGHALLIPRCQSIHMFFMRFPIDVIFCDKAHRVVGLTRGIKPFRLSPIFFKASYALELPVGSIAASGTQRGDIIAIII